MEKLKNILKSDTPTGDDTSATGTSRLSGQGSHFPGKDETSNTTGSTVTGTDPSTRGPADVSAVSGSSTAAATTTGPEQGGSGHVGTTSAGQGITSGAKDYTVSSADFPRTQGSTDGSGTAAVGQTGTYTSSHLSHGDPTSSVVDPSSSDPLTYKKPEATSHSSGAGVGSGAASTAAGLAFAQGEERKKDMPGHENPYRTTHLDPRVDGLSKASAEQATSHPPATTSSTSTSHGAGLGTAAETGAGAGLAGAGVATAYNSSSKAHETTPAPSSLTSTANPTDRSSEYTSSTNTKGLDAAGTTGTSGTSGAYGTGATTAAETTGGENRQSVVGKVLGAVGLGGVAGSLGYGAAASQENSAVADTPHQPTTTTGLTSYTAPTQQGASTGHHRKESIPTTAYPSGTLDSVRAINQPVGGAGSPVVHGDHDQQGHTGRNVATGLAAGGAATAGATALGAHEEHSGSATAHHATTVGDASTTSPAGVGKTGATSDTTTAGAYSGQSPTVGGSSTAHTSTMPEKSHTARDTAIGAGAGAAVAGAGAYGAHEYGSRDVGKATTQPSTTGTSGSTVGEILTTSPVGANKTGATSDATTAGAYSGPPPTLAGSGTAHTTAMSEQTVGAGTTGMGSHGYSGRDIGKSVDHPSSTTATTSTADEKDHTARDTAVGAGAGAAAVGAGAYGAHEHNQKDLEKQHKAEEKAAAKEEKKHQKELEKEEKKHHKELEKEEKHQHQLEKEAEERRKREEREKLAGATAVGGAGAATAEHEREKDKEKEKKPSIFRRIFKRRKNDKGEEEEYSSDEEQPHHSNTPEAAAYGTAIVAGGGAATYEAERRKSSTSAPGTSKYEQLSGGVQKPSYNPLHKKEESAIPGQTPSSANTFGSTAGLTEAVTGTPSYPEAYRDTKGVGDNVHIPGTITHDNKLGTTGATAATGTAAATGVGAATGTTGTTGTTGEHARESITGLPYDASKDPEAARRISQHTHGSSMVDSGATGTHDKGIAPSTLESTGVASSQPTEAVTGTTAATKTHGSTAPGTVESTGVHTQQPAGAVTGLPHSSATTEHTTGSTTTSTGEYKPNTNFTLGEIQDERR